MEKFVYKGYLCSDAETFFGNNIIREERDGCGVVGHFIKLKDGSIHLPSKGDVFLKDGDGKIYKEILY
jgi:hypothetical protein